MDFYIEQILKHLQEKNIEQIQLILRKEGYSIEIKAIKDGGDE